MKLTLAILSLAVLYCIVQGASVGNVDELKPLVETVTSKISDLLKKVESEKEVTNIIIKDSEEIRNAAQLVMKKTFDTMKNDNVENVVKEDDEKKFDIMRFIAENAISNDDIVKILFADDQLEEDDLRAAVLMNSLKISGEGLEFDFTGFTSASSEDDKRLELNNMQMWCQAIVKISGALVSAVDDAQMTMRTQMGAFGDEQQAPSDGEETPELPPAGEETPELPPAGEETPELPPAGKETPELPPAGEETPELPPSGEETPVLPPAGKETPVLPPAGKEAPELPPAAEDTPELPLAGKETPVPPPTGKETPVLPPAGKD